MAYNKQDIFKQALKAAKEKSLYFIEDIVAYIPCDKTTFYRFFPVDCNEYNTIKSELENNKIQTKVEIREKLKAGSKATELIALYKLICTDEERVNLSMTHLDHTSKGKEMKTLTDPEREQRIKELKEKLGIKDENDE
jgi:hypothetical protein